MSDIENYATGDVGGVEAPDIPTGLVKPTDGEKLINLNGLYHYLDRFMGNNKINLSLMSDKKNTLGTYSTIIIPSAAFNTSVTYGGKSVSIGYNTIATGTSSVSIGSGSKTGNYSSSDTNPSNDSVAIGSNAKTRMESSISIGKNANCYGVNAISIGSATSFSEMGFGAFDYSIAIGYCAQAGLHKSISPNTYNTAVGSSASAIGGYSTAIGANSSASANYAVALGYQCSNSVASTIQLGSTNATYMTAIRARVTSITSTSDIRDKTDIADLSSSRKFINTLRPVTYVWNERETYKSEPDFDDEENMIMPIAGIHSYDKEAHARGDKKGTEQQVGLISQEVKAAMEECYGSSDYFKLVDEQYLGGSDAPDDQETQMALNYTNLIPVMIKAMQEMDAEIHELKAKITELEENN